MAKRFVKYDGTKAQFAAAKANNVLLSTTYEKSIVLITGGTSGVPCIYTRGKYINDAEEFLRSIPYVKGVTDADGETVVTGGSAAVIPFRVGNSAAIKGETAAPLLDVTVDSNGVTYSVSDNLVTVVNAALTDAENIRTDLGNKSDAKNASGSAFARIAQLAADVAALGGTDGTISEAIEKAVDALRGEIVGTLGSGDSATLEAINDELDSIQVDLNELGNIVSTNATKATVTVEKQGTAETGYSATYVVKQNGTQVGAKINIPKDQFLKSAALVKGTWASDKFTESTTGTGKAIKLEMNIDGTDSNTTVDVLYINVADLVDVYTAQGSAAEVQVAISDSNVISATIVNGSVNANKLASNAVTTAKILDGNVTEGKLASNAVTTAKIKDGNVTYAKLHTDVLDNLVYKVTWASSGNIDATTSSAIRNGAAVLMGVVINQVTTYYPARYVDKGSAGYLLVTIVGNREYILTVSNSASSSGHSFTGSNGNYDVLASSVPIDDTGNKLAATTVEAALAELAEMWDWEDISAS